MAKKFWLFVVVAITLAVAVSSKQVSGTGKCHFMHGKSIHNKYLQKR